jgi:hypothetical protein
VGDLTRGGRLSIYDESVLIAQAAQGFIRGKCARTGQTPSEATITNKTRQGWVIFLQLARQAALPARCSILYLFSDAYNEEALPF